MRAVIQRVTQASVTVDGERIAEIGTGLLILLGITHDDEEGLAIALARKVHSLRILREERSLLDNTDSSVLLVSQFTLYGDARKGRRPSWSRAAPGAFAEPLVRSVALELARLGVPVQTGRFGADMLVTSVNDGPVTLILDL